LADAIVFVVCPYIADDKNGGRGKRRDFAGLGITWGLFLSRPYNADRFPYIADDIPYIADDKPYFTDDNPYIADIASP